jgi:hypothetical protein
MKAADRTGAPFSTETDLRPAAPVSPVPKDEPEVGPASRTEWWEWPTILSLDAPAVGVLWQWILALALGVPLRAHHVVILGASIWMSYAADRWFEGWRLTRVFTRRHLFYQRYRWQVAVLWLTVFAATVVLALTRLNAAELKGGLLLLGFVLLYLFSHQVVHRNFGWRAPKEICVAFLLGGGAALFPAASATSLGPIAPPLVFFMLLCFANCLLISAWESGIDTLHGQTSIALQFRRGVLLAAAVPWGVAGLAAAFLATGAAGAAEVAALCALVSGILLGLLHIAEPRLGRRAARVLADVVLMTPALPLVWPWLR